MGKGRGTKSWSRMGRKGEGNRTGRKVGKGMKEGKGGGQRGRVCPVEEGRKGGQDRQRREGRHK